MGSRWSALCARSVLTLACASSLVGCAAWCNLRGGDYEVTVPPDEDETRTCVMPEEPALDGGKPCTDGSQCAKGRLCPDELVEQLSRELLDGADLRDLNLRGTPVTNGACASLRRYRGVSCHVEHGKAVVDMVVI